jgi:UrcA family protein
MNKQLIASFLLAVTSAHNTSAFAQDVAPTRTVFYGDLDLTSSPGQQTLDRRLGNAVNSLCGERDIRDLGLYRAYRMCRDAAQASTRAQVMIAMASAHRRLTGHESQTVRLDIRR